MLVLNGASADAKGPPGRRSAGPGIDDILKDGDVPRKIGAPNVISSPPCRRKMHPAC